MKTGPPRPPRPRPHPTPGLFTYLTAPSGAWGGSGPGCVGSSLPVAAGSEASIRSSGGVAGGSAGGSSGRGGTGPSAWAGERAPLLPWGEGGGWLGGAGRLLPPGWGLWRCQGGPAHLQAVQDALDVPQHVLGHQQPHTGLALQRQQGVNVGGGWGTTEPTPARPPSKPPPPHGRERQPPHPGAPTWTGPWSMLMWTSTEEPSICRTAKPPRSAQYQPKLRVSSQTPHPPKPLTTTAHREVEGPHHNVAVGIAVMARPPGASPIVGGRGGPQP